MAVRKKYEEFLALADQLVDEIKELSESNDELASLKKKYSDLLKQATAAFDKGADMAKMKEFAVALKELKGNKFKSWEKARKPLNDAVSKSSKKSDDLILEITDALRARVVDEDAHLLKHRNRIAKAQTRIDAAINAKVRQEESKLEKDLNDAKRKAKEDKDAGVPVDTAALAALQAKYDKFSVPDRTAELWSSVKYTAAEAKAIDAANKRIEIYEKIRAKKLKKYESIIGALKAFKNQYNVITIEKISRMDW